MTRVARRSAVRVADRKNVPFTAAMSSGEVKNVASWIVTTTGTAGAQRHRVVRRVDDLGGELLGDQRQAGLLPGQPGRPVRDGGRAGDDVACGATRE